MAKRDHYTEAQRAAERIKTRERMRRLYADPDYRARTAARRAARDAERKATDPAFVERLRERRRRHKRIKREFERFMSSLDA